MVVENGRFIELSSGTGKFLENFDNDFDIVLMLGIEFILSEFLSYGSCFFSSLDRKLSCTKLSLLSLEVDNEFAGGKVKD